MDGQENNEGVSISIVIPVYNRAEILPATLESILIQTFPIWECIIVDDLSTDGTPGVVADYQRKDNRFKFFSRNPDQVKGPSTCRNIGIEEARGKYIMFVDSDDLLYSSCLKTRINFASKNPDCQFWIFKTETRSSGNKSIFNVLPDKEKNESFFYIKKFLNGQMPFHTMSPLWLRCELQLIKGFDSSFLLFEDPEIHLRYLLKGVEVKTAMNGSPDSVYNMAAENIKEVDVELRQKKVLYYKYLFGLKFQKFIREHSADFYKYALQELAFPYNSRRYIFKFLKTGVRSNNLSLFFAFKSSVLALYHLVGIPDVKGIGYHTIRNWAFKS